MNQHGRTAWEERCWEGVALKCIAVRLNYTEELYTNIFYADQLLHRKGFVHRSSYTEKSLHREVFIQRSLDAEKVEHTHTQRL